MLSLKNRKKAAPDPTFRKRYEKALANIQMSRNITTFQNNWRPGRDASMEQIEFDRLRNELNATKRHVVEDLDKFLDQFSSMAKRVGVNVHRAADADEATAIVQQICESHGATEIAKSKSMVSEEIELNHRLAEVGIDVLETDAGEWIVQQMHERPSHIVGPALHLGRKEVRELLNTVQDEPISLEDIPEQVDAIRNAVRPAFFSAGVGMNGANALIAESGTVMIVTNEGNGRLSGSMPPVQIVLAGIEKLVPTFSDAMTQVKLLARSATGQRLTVYTTFMTGPTPGHETHIVLVDNGRRAMKALPEFSEALYCIRCGACSNVCPPYGEVSGHVFGHIYSGAIGLVVSEFHHGLDSIAKPQSLCLSCNACEVACPVGIPLPRQIIDVRKHAVDEYGLPPVKQAALEVYSRPRAFDLANRAGTVFDRPVLENGFIKSDKLPVLKDMTSWRSLPAPASPPLRDQVPSGSFLERFDPVAPNQAAGKTVALFPGCLTDRLYPDQGLAISDTLRLLGMRVAFPAGLNCCGLPANNSGDEKRAKRMAKQTIEALEEAWKRVPAHYIVSGSASCIATLTQDYEHLFRDEPAWLGRAQHLATRTMDFTTFLDQVVQLEDGALKAEESLTVTYHDSCQGMNALGLQSEPRRLLVDVLGCELREIPDVPMCCGFGGSFSFDYPEVASRLMNRKLDAAEKTGAHIVVTDNQGCILHLRGGCDAEGRPIEVVHIAELLAQRLKQMQQSA